MFVFNEILMLANSNQAVPVAQGHYHLSPF
jgi:hypothetical protein